MYIVSGPRPLSDGQSQVLGREEEGVIRRATSGLCSDSAKGLTAGG